MRPVLMLDRHRMLRHWQLIVFCIMVTGWLPNAAAADEIVAKGNIVDGTITHLSAKGADIDTAFGKLTIPFADMQRIETDAPLRILYGEDEEIVGRVLGIKDGTLLVGESLANAHAISISSIVGAGPGSPSVFAVLRSRLRYWSGTADVGFGLTQATVDNTTVSAGLGLERDKGPNRLSISIAGHYGTQKRQRPEPAGPETHLADDLGGSIKDQHDLTPRVFLWAAGDAKYDGLQKMSYRVVPAGGLGYYLYKADWAYLEGLGGGSYVYERFFGGSSNSIRGVNFGGEANAVLPYAATFHWRMDYLPAINDWTNSYLLRNDATLLFPLAGAFNLKLEALDDYDSHPARDSSGRLLAKENKLVTTAGLAVTF
jgi:Protein of unknown function, DUF481